MENMSFEQLLGGIQELGRSQGKYGRLYNAIMELDEDEFEELRQRWNYKFNNMVDFVLYMEC